MALTSSNMMPIGTKAPGFELLDVVTGELRSLQNLKGDKATLVMFICNHCPFVKHVEAGLIALGKTYLDQISLIAISSNDALQFPDDSPAAMKDIATKREYPFPYLYDESQDVAKAYDATCTPDFFLFDSHLLCTYRGQLDDSRPNNGIDVTGNDLRAAIDSLLEGKPSNKEQKPSIGCNIK